MRTLLSLTVISLATLAYGQVPSGSFVASISGPQRLSIIKSSVEVNAVHEPRFWPMYDQYISDAEDISMDCYRTTHHLATLDKHVSEEDALAAGQLLLKKRLDQLNVIKEYHTEIASSFNGIISFQFAQAETLMDMMEIASIYENTHWKNYRFLSRNMPYEKYEAAKRNIMEKALQLTPSQKQKFWELYKQYETEADAVTGINYNMISLYAVEPADFTPALAKRMGKDFLQLMEREIKLKERFFNKMRDELGAPLAAKFLVWEDYYSIVSKMFAWADAP